MPHLNTSTHLYGVDAEGSWIKGAQKRAIKLKIEKQTTYLESHAERLPFEENSMDIVTCQTLLIHVADMKKVIQEMLRVLKPGGLFLFAEPNNFGSTAAQYVSLPIRPWSEVSELLELEYHCTQGKFVLGEGHQSAGQIGPQSMTRCGRARVSRNWTSARADIHKLDRYS